MTDRPRSIYWQCPACHTRSQYVEDHDAYACPTCNKWLEDACEDADCPMCSTRAAQPFPEAV